MRIFAIGSSITSCYWNGAATYYRGIYRALAQLGHEIIFAEPDAYSRQQHRDGPDSDFAYVHSWVYQSPRDLGDVLAEAASCDLVIKHSGVGVDDEFLEGSVVGLRSPQTSTAFWDVDAPATLARIRQDPGDPFRALIGDYDIIFTYGGGPPVVSEYLRSGARQCVPIYNALDPVTHYRVEAKREFACDLAFVGNRLPDRERRVEEFFLRAACLAPDLAFLLGGEGWQSKELPPNVRWIGHVGTGDHNAVNSSARMVLNINRESMAAVGFSPPTRVFEAAGAAACVVTDAWPGVERFFAPESEILVAASAEDIVRHLRETSAVRARSIAEAMLQRALHEHTYAMRAQQVNAVLRALDERKAAA